MTPEKMPWHTVALDKAIGSLIDAGNALSLMAQTSGGTAGRDDALCAASAHWDAEREKVVQVRRIVHLEWDDPEIGVGIELDKFLGEICGMKLREHALHGLARAAITAMQESRDAED